MNDVQKRLNKARAILDECQANLDEPGCSLRTKLDLAAAGMEKLRIAFRNIRAPLLPCLSRGLFADYCRRAAADKAAVFGPDLLTPIPTDALRAMHKLNNEMEAAARKRRPAPKYHTGMLVVKGSTVGFIMVAVGPGGGWKYQVRIPEAPVETDDDGNPKYPLWSEGSIKSVKEVGKVEFGWMDGPLRSILGGLPGYGLGRIFSSEGTESELRPEGTVKHAAEQEAIRRAAIAGVENLVLLGVDVKAAERATSKPTPEPKVPETLMLEWGAGGWHLGLLEIRQYGLHYRLFGDGKFLGKVAQCEIPRLCRDLCVIAKVPIPQAVELWDAQYLLWHVFDRLWTSSPDRTKVLEVQRLLKDVKQPGPKPDQPEAAPDMLSKQDVIDLIEAWLDAERAKVPDYKSPTSTMEKRRHGRYIEAADAIIRRLQETM